MNLPASQPAAAPLAKGVRRLGGIDDMAGGGQVTVEGDFAYVGHMKSPHGTSIVDISDPRAPKVVAAITLPDDTSHTHKVRVTGDIMVVNVEQADRHFRRRAARIGAETETLSADLGRAPTEAELAERLGIPEARMEDLRRHATIPYEDGGFRVYDIRDKSNPRLLAHHRTGGIGVHRFDLDERYAWISTEMEGYRGNILVAYDLSDPSHPVEAGRWSAPGQNVAAGEVPDWPGQTYRLHHGLRFGDEVWAAWWHEGFRVLDVSDPSAMREVGYWPHPKAFPEPLHTAMPLPGTFDGRRYALAIDEEHDHRPGTPHAFIWVLDVTDLSAIEPVATFEVSELDSPWSRAGLRFGAHQFAERPSASPMPVAWFAGGIRMLDLSDPTRPSEIGHYIPEPRGGAAAPQTNDVDVDGRGFVHAIDRLCGYDILEPAM
ncbi:RNA polymerase subunit sigma-70 [Silicimonas algicola]|uniref:RNA polymerase sigma-70 region 3 domain-containing protein n=1 Tax=Silicimonas algicola TaxID=1826607 RepID=A0A316GL00_9RHOB|nr:sigma-70 domain-containing protein [Silicimonas algicola]AZQ66988.1 RNA polymerase subunit sigma-70 [Silicimonas algicola]PWK55497.1 hypothetical protein C8D95_107163 [Silicimonas algicola]